MDDYTLNLYKLTHLNIDLNKSDAIYLNDDSTVLKIFLNKSISACKHCNSINILIRSSVVNNINYSIFFDHKVTIELHRRKYYCRDCSRYFLEPNPIVSENKNISFMTDLQILKLLKEPTMTYEKAAELTFTSPSYVQKVFDNKIRFSKSNLSTVICIDETYAKKLVEKKYICTLYNPFEKKVIAILDSRLKEDIVNFGCTYSISERLKVKYVSIDLWRSYKEMAKIVFPYAKICADSFHVIEHLNICFDNIRKRVQKRFEDKKYDPNSYYWLYKKYFKFLLMDVSGIYSGQIVVRKYPSEMYMSKYQIIDYMLSLDDELKYAYELKEEYRSFNQAASLDDAADRLNDLIILFKRSRIKEYYPFITTLQNWFDEIVNSFTKLNGKRIHNGYIERYNKLVKQLFDNGFGMSNFERTKNRIAYIVNNLNPSGTSKPKSNKRIGRPRGKYNK